MAKKSETLEPETIVQDLMKQKEIKDHHGHSGNYLLIVSP